jgi:hypothetical protein
MERYRKKEVFGVVSEHVTDESEKQGVKFR